MNHVTLIGNLARDPELRATSGGKSVCNFTLAVNRRFTNQQGEREADFIPVVVWGAQADACGRYLTKGRKAAVEGGIQVRSYAAQDGSKRYATEVVASSVEFLSAQDRGGGGQGSAPAPTATQSGARQPKPVQDSMDLYPVADDDELPF